MIIPVDVTRLLKSTSFNVRLFLIGYRFLSGSKAAGYLPGQE
jgi:hypothetical protein